MSDELDYSAYQEKPEESAFAELVELAERHVATKKAVADAEAALKRAQQDFIEVSEQLLPEVMDKLGLEQFKTKSGLRINIKESIHASLPKKDKRRYEDGLAWLEANNWGRIIKHQLVTPLGKDKEEEAKVLADEIRSRGFEVNDVREIHASTLRAFIKERLEEGDDIPQDLFNIHRRRVAEVK